MRYNNLFKIISLSCLLLTTIWCNASNVITHYDDGYSQIQLIMTHWQDWYVSPNNKVTASIPQ